MEIRNLGGLAVTVIAMVAIDALWAPAKLLAAALAPSFFVANIRPDLELLDAIAVAFMLVTSTVFATWIYRCGKKLRDSGVDSLEFTPASRVWWFFVPVANLVKPFQGMRELWNASYGTWPYDSNQSLLSTWWALWIIHSISANFATRFEMGSWAIADAAIGIFLAATAIMLVRGITLAQSQLGDRALSEVFA